jgi:uncharacterized integral membrane protein
VSSEQESPDAQPTRPDDDAAAVAGSDAGGGPGPDQTQPEAQRQEAQRQEARRPTSRRTRIGGAWTAVAVAVVVLLLLLIFILQNLQTVRVTYLGASGQLPLGVAVLLAAVGGALLVVVLGVARMIQLRTYARRQRRHQRKAAKQ